MKKRPRLPLPWTLLFVAIPLFLWLFALRQLGPLDFWWWMSINLVFLLILSRFLDPGLWERMFHLQAGNRMKLVLGGIISAVLLYGVFAVGGWMLRLIFPAAGTEISSVYAYRGSASPWRIGLLMALVIGPGEEFFWRGMVQHHLVNRYGSTIGVMAGALVYTLVHLPTANPVLLLAALTCGLFWGILYDRTRSLPLVAISHTAWDILVFLLLPLAVGAG